MKHSPPSRGTAPDTCKGHAERGPGCGFFSRAPGSLRALGWQFLLGLFIPWAMSRSQRLCQAPAGPAGAGNRADGAPSPEAYVPVAASGPRLSRERRKVTAHGTGGWWKDRGVGGRSGQEVTPKDGQSPQSRHGRGSGWEPPCKGPVAARTCIPGTARRPVAGSGGVGWGGRAGGAATRWAGPRGLG